MGEGEVSGGAHATATGSESVLFAWETTDGHLREIIAASQFLRFVELATAVWHVAVTELPTQVWRTGDVFEKHFFTRARALDVLKIRAVSYRSPLVFLAHIDLVMFFPLVLQRSIDLVKRLAVFSDEVNTERARLRAELERYKHEILHQRAKRIKEFLELQETLRDLHQLERQHTVDEFRIELINSILEDLKASLQEAIGSSAADTRIVELKETLSGVLSTDELAQALSTLPRLAMVVFGPEGQLEEKLEQIREGDLPLAAELEVEGLAAPNEEEKSDAE